MEHAEGLEPLLRLEERIRHTVEQLQAARRENAALKAERRQIMERLEKLLAQIDLLGAG